MGGVVLPLGDCLPPVFDSSFVSQSDRHSIRILFTDRYFITGLFIAFLVMLPWFVRNTIYYKNPLHSTQNYVAGYIGWEDWESKTFHVYWDEKPPSWIEGKLSKGIGRVAQMSFDFMETYLWWMLMDITSYPPGKINFSGWFIVMVTDYREPEISPSGLEWEPPNEVQYLINPQKI